MEIPSIQHCRTQGAALLIVSLKLPLNSITSRFLLNVVSVAKDKLRDNLDDKNDFLNFQLLPVEVVKLREFVATFKIADHAPGEVPQVSSGFLPLQV